MATWVTALLSMETCLDSLAIQENDALLSRVCPGDVCINGGVGRVPPSTLPARFLPLSRVCGIAGLDKVDDISLLVIQRKVSFRHPGKKSPCSSFSVCYVEDSFVFIMFRSHFPQRPSTRHAVSS